MGSRLKEEERNERTIRALLKLSENRRCINCGSLGPQYVCTTFSTFVCTNCSGIHREFSHRIKSVSMAKFAAEEVRNLQAGGNERARELLLKDFDLQRNPLPDSSNENKLREFIKSVYEERRYTGERPPPKGRQGDRDDFYEARRPELRPDSRSDARSPRGDYRPDSRSPPFEDRHDDRRFMERRRSDVDRGRYDDRRFDDRRFDDRVVRFEEKRSPSRFEPDRSRYDQKNQYDDRRQDDRSRFEERERERRASYDDRFANEIRHDRRRSADDRLNFKDADGDSPPVRPVTEILGDNVPALWVEDYRSTNGRDDDDRSSLGSPAEQRRDIRVPRLGSFGSANGSAIVPPAAAIKRVNSGSLIDFSAEPEPSTAVVPAADPFGVSSAVIPKSTAVSASSTGWATFDTVPVATAPVATVGLSSEGPPAGYPDAFLATANGGQWAASGWPSSQLPTTPASDNWSSLVGSSLQQQTIAAGSEEWKPFPPVSKAATPQMALFPPSELQQEQPKTSSALTGVDRSRELPKDLFATSFPTMGVQTGRLGMGPQMPGFVPAVPPFAPLGAMPPYAPQPRSRNPFDLPLDVAPPMGMGTFPSMGPLQAALPTGQLSVPVSVSPTANQWSMGLQPASYPPIGPAGGTGSIFISQLNSAPSSAMPGQAVGLSFGFAESGSFSNRAAFAAGPSFSASESSERSAQNFLRPVGGNPFG